MRIVLPTLHLRASSQATPLAAGCLAATLPAPWRSAARLLDFFPSQAPVRLREEIVSLRPDLIAFPLYVWNRKTVLALARELRRDLPNVWLVAGGPEAACDTSGILTQGEFDAVVRGEGEVSFVELVEALARGDRPSGLAGITWRQPGGAVAGPERSPPVLADLPSPWLTGVLRPPPGGGVLWEVSRGGGAGHDFGIEGCAGGRHLGTERLEAELDLFVRAGVAEIRVLDPVFNFPPERGKELLRLLLRRAPRQRLHLDGWAEFIDAETAQLLSRLSASLRLELQSFRPGVLHHLHRPSDPELLARNLHLLHAEGVQFQLELTFGLPGDDPEGFRASVNTALELTPDRLDLSPLAIYPGTALYRNRARFDFQAPKEPPYEILATATFGADDLQASRRLAGAVEIFYNLGHAAAFLPALLQATGQEAVSFLEGFLDWAGGPARLSKDRLRSGEGWSRDEILRLQEGYAEAVLRQKGRAELVPAALDLIRYHFHYAETQIGEELPTPTPQNLAGLDLWGTRWRRNPLIRLATFSYEILDLIEMVDIHLEQFASLFRPVGSVALFARRGDQVFCESLDENMQRLFLGCDGLRSPREIFSGSVSRQEGEEILEYAVSEGLLVPAD